MKVWQLIAAIVLIGLGGALRSEGLDRSLWLDEAWVANSLLEPSLQQTFHYERWLQTTPPGFLLLARGGLALFGKSNWAFRIVPFLFSLLSLVAMALAIRAFVPTRRYFVLPLGLAVIVFAPEAIVHGRVLKQYSSDVAVAACLLWMGLRQRKHLVWALPLAPFFSYPSVFLLPGLLWLAPRRWWTAALVAASTGLLYFVFLAPNQSTALREHWAGEYHSLRHLKTILGGATFALAFSALSLLLVRRRRKLLLLLVVIPLLGAIAAEKLHVYPMVPRTSLFLLPSLALAFAGAIWACLLRWRRAVNPVLVAACVALVVYGYREAPPVGVVEDADGAVTEIYSRWKPGDQVYVHASMAENFRLYAAVRGLEQPTVFWGSTGSPCCPRGAVHVHGKSGPVEVAKDLDRLLPARFQGRLWAIWTNRPDHWLWNGTDETKAIGEEIARRGCKARPTLPFDNVGLQLFDCRD